MFAQASAAQISRVDGILRQLELIPGRPSDANRRLGSRLEMRATLSAFLLSTTGEASVTIFSRNLSRSGIGFVCGRLCKIGERLALPFDLPGKPRKLVLAKITFCRYVSAGLYTVGAEFVDCVDGHEGKGRVPPHWIPRHPSRASAANAAAYARSAKKSA